MRSHDGGQVHRGAGARARTHLPYGVRDIRPCDADHSLQPGNIASFRAGSGERVHRVEGLIRDAHIRLDSCAEERLSAPVDIHVEKHSQNVKIMITVSKVMLA